MKFAVEGELIAPKGSGSFWAVEIAPLGIHTQGTSRKNAYEMAKDAVETIFDSKIDVNVDAVSEDKFIVVMDYCEEVVSRILRQIRMTTGKNIMELSKKLGSSSPNAYSRYEHGTLPKPEKLEELLHALNPKLEPMLKIGNR